MQMAHTRKRAADGNRTPRSARPVDTSRWRVVVCIKSGLTVSAPEHGRSFAPGDQVDLATEVVPGHTWREALGDHVSEFFVPFEGEGA
jgi:hypothetical protein